MSDYVLGGRRLGSFTTALSAGSSTTSAWTMLALPGLAFSGGLVEMWIPIGAVVGIGLSWTLLAGRLRRFTIAANDALTIPEFYAARFGDRGGILRTLTSLLTIVFVVFYVSSGLIGGSKLLETIFGIEAGIGIVLTLLAVASYTLIGGFLAVSRTDVFQALLMLFGLLLITVALAAAGSASAAALAGLTPAFFDPLTGGGGAPISITFILSVAGWGFGAFGSQRILQRFMALEQKARVGGQPQHISRLAGRRIWTRPGGRPVGPSGPGRSRPAGRGRRPGADLLGRFRGLFPSGDRRSAAYGGNCRGHEHRRLAAVVGVGGCHRGPAAGERNCRFDDRPGTGLAGKGAAAGYRIDRAGGGLAFPRFDICVGQLRLGRNGRRVRAGNPAGALLAAVQLLGGAGIDGRWHLGRHDLGVLQRRTRRNARHSAGYSGICNWPAGRHPGHAAHARAHGRGR